MADIVLHYWTACLLKIGPIGYPETSVTKYQSTLPNILEERRSQGYNRSAGQELLLRSTRTFHCGPSPVAVLTQTTAVRIVTLSALRDAFQHHILSPTSSNLVSSINIFRLQFRTHLSFLPFTLQAPQVTSALTSLPSINVTISGKTTNY